MRGLLTDPAVWAVAVEIVLSAVQLTAYWLIARKKRAGWIVGIAGGAPWLAFLTLRGAWGMILLVLGLQTVYIYGLVTWRRGARETAQALSPAEYWTHGYNDGVHDGRLSAELGGGGAVIERTNPYRKA